MSEFLKGHLLALLLRVLSLFPIRLLRIIGNVVGQILWWVNSRSRRTTEINLQLCFPQLPEQERRELAHRSVIESAKTALETPAIWCWPANKTRRLIKKISGMHYLDAALQKKSGIIILAPHLGNWEVVGFFCASIGKMTSLYAPAKFPALDQLMYRGRSRNGSSLAPTNASGVKMLLKALRANETVGILPDQVPDPEGGLYAPFFGEQAFTMTLIATLAARTGAVVICCYAKRLQAEGGFEICFLPAAEDIASIDLQQAVTALNQSVEQCVMDCPEQYQWEYKRFRKRPSGERLYQ